MIRKTLTRLAIVTALPILTFTFAKAQNVDGSYNTQSSGSNYNSPGKLIGVPQRSVPLTPVAPTAPANSITQTFSVNGTSKNDATTAVIIAANSSTFAQDCFFLGGQFSIGNVSSQAIAPITIYSDDGFGNLIGTTYSWQAAVVAVCSPPN